MRKALTLVTFLFLNSILLAQIDTSGFSQAKELYGQGKFSEAEEILKKIEKSSPEFAPCFYVLGLIYHDESNYKKAEKYYLLAGEKDKNYGEPYSDLSSLMFSQQKYKEAIEYAKISIVRDSTNAKAYINLASSLNQIGEYEASKENFIEAAKIDPLEILNLGNIMLRQYNDPNAAIYYFGILYDLYPPEPLIIMNLGSCFRMLGNIEIALEIFANGYEYTETSHEMFGLIYSNYFRLLFENKLYEKIIESSFDKVSETYPHAYFFNSLAYFALGENKLFLESAEKYFSLSGEDKPEDINAWVKSYF